MAPRAFLGDDGVQARQADFTAKKAPSLSNLALMFMGSKGLCCSEVMPKKIPLPKNSEKGDAC